MNTRIRRILKTAAACAWLVCATATANAQTTVADLLAKMPAQTTADGDAAFAEFAGLGADAIKEVCAQLVAPGTGDDTNARYLLSGLAKHVTRTGAESDRAVVEGAFIDALAPAADNEVKAFLIHQVQLVGGERSVAPLTALLADERLCEPATQAMLAIRTPSAIAAFETALPSATDATRVTIIQALGVVRSKTVVAQFLPLATSEDATTRRAALAALANIGDPAAGDVLAKAAQADTPYERSLGTSWYLLYARRLADAGDKAPCEAICRDLLATRTRPEDAYAQSAALSTLAGVIGDAVQSDLLAVMDSPNRGLRGTALKLAGRVAGGEATAQWVAKLGQTPPEVKVEILSMLADRGDISAAPAALAALKSEDKGVRIAAVNACVQLAKADALQDILAVLQVATEDDEIKTAKGALLRLPGESVVPAIAEAVPTMPPAPRKALIEALASRKASEHVETVFAQANDADGGVRVAAIKALEHTAGPDHLPRIVALVLAAQDDAERSVARSVVVSVAKQIAEPEARIAPVVASLDGAPADKGVHLLPLFPEIAGQPALNAVVARTTAPDAAIKNAAVEALGSWPDAAALAPLLAVVKTDSDAGHQATAMGGYVRLVDAAKKPPKEAVKLYADALATAKRPDEKKVVLAVLGEVHAVEALQLAATYLDDESLKADAAGTAVSIACPQDEKDDGLLGADVANILKRAIAATDDEALRKQAQDHIASMPIPDEFNLAQGKPVTTSVAQQGDKKPELAVDGRTDLDSAWFGDGSPSWLQVDLGETVAIDKANVLFYWDGSRYYQYTLDVSVDGEAWATAADMSGNTTPGTPKGVMLTFAPAQARYVRVNIIKNSANPAVHLVELKVYAEGTAPPAPPEPVADAEGFVPIFNGKDLTGWTGDTQGYVAENETIVCKPGGNLYTEKEYANFHLKFEFLLTPGSNNGLGIRVPNPAHAAYQGMELQILDNTADKYKDLKPWQYHGSIYGIVPAERGHLKPVGEWNAQEVIANGRQITIILNGTTIVDANLDEASKDGTMDGKDHPGLKREKGYICFAGHGSRVDFRNLRIKELP
jgi:HEAT repeat protein